LARFFIYRRQRFQFITVLYARLREAIFTLLSVFLLFSSIHNRQLTDYRRTHGVRQRQHNYQLNYETGLNDHDDRTMTANDDGSRD